MVGVFCVLKVNITGMASTGQGLAAQLAHVLQFVWDD